MDYERTPPNVADWMEYWQKRAEKAEAENAELRVLLADRECDLQFEYDARKEAEANYEGLKDNNDMESWEMYTALRERVAELEAKLRDAHEALAWCGGSDDFAPDGKAREGWEKVVLPVLNSEYPIFNGEGVA